MILKLERGQSTRWELIGVLDEDEVAREKVESAYPESAYPTTEVELAVGYTSGTYGSAHEGLRACIKSLLAYEYAPYDETQWTP